jgi:hypothetical protein
MSSTVLLLFSARALGSVELGFISEEDLEKGEEIQL